MIKLFKPVDYSLIRGLIQEAIDKNKASGKKVTVEYVKSDRQALGGYIYPRDVKITVSVE